MLISGRRSDYSTALNLQNGKSILLIDVPGVKFSQRSSGQVKAFPLGVLADLPYGEEGKRNLG